MKTNETIFKEITENGYREIDIINNSSPSDFVFEGFNNAGNGWFRVFYDLPA